MMDNHTVTLGVVADAQHEAARVSPIIAPFIFLMNHSFLIFALLVTLYAAQISYNIFFHPLSKIPGPLFARANSLWIILNHFSGQWHKTTAALHDRYGPVVRIAPDTVSFVDKEGLKRIYGFGQGTVKSPWYKTWQLQGVGPNVFATQDSGLHRQLRGRIAPAYSMNSVLRMEPFIQELLDQLWSKMKEFSQDPKPVNMSRWLYFFTYDAISELALGGALGFIKQGTDVSGLVHSIGAAFQTQFPSGYLPGNTFWFQNAATQWFIRHFCSQSAQGMNIFVQFLSDRFDERAKNGLGDRRKDMLQYFFEMKSITGKPVDKGEVMTEGMAVLGAGGDTTAASLAAILARMITNPEIVPRLQQEVDAAYKRLGLRKDEGISYTEASKLPYLSAVIKETMRLFPVAQSQLPRMAPEEGITIDGHFIPKGTQLGMAPTLMNRSKEIFGPSADEFRPERWIPTNAKDEEDAKEASSLLTTFGFGSRGCLGKNIAIIEIQKFTAQFVRQFEIKSAYKDKLWRTENFFVTFIEDFMCNLTERTT